MTDEDRQKSDNKGFWDGGLPGHGSNRESGGRKSGFPGPRGPRRTGVQTDLDAPPAALDPSSSGRDRKES